MTHQRIKTDKLEISTCNCQSKEDTIMIFDKVNNMIYSRFSQDELIELLKKRNT